MVSKTTLATFSLMGALMGAGVLGLPYVIMKSGFLIGFIEIMIIGTILVMTNLYLGEISLRTKEKHQLPGLAKKYLGTKSEVIMLIVALFGLYASLIAYLIGESESLSYLITNTSNYILPLGIIIWLVFTLISHIGLKATEEGEEIGVIAIILLVAIISIFLWNNVEPTNLQTMDIEHIFLPLGAILFTFLGCTAIPEAREVIGRETKNFKKVIIRSFVAISILFLIFIAIVIGTQGTSTPEIATLALGKPFIILGMLSMFTAYLAHSMAINEIFRFDLKLSKKKAKFYTSIVPLVMFVTLYIINQISFIKIISLGGAISGGIIAILVLLMVGKAKTNGNRNPEYKMPYSKKLIYFLIAIFVFATISATAALMIR